MKTPPAQHAPPTGATAPTAQELLHELQAHQIELEMQNEALREAQAALEASRDHYADLYEFAPTGYVTLSADGCISKINLAGAALLGIDRGRLISRHFSGLVSAPDRPRWHQLLQRARSRQTNCADELCLAPGNGGSLQTLIECRHAAELGAADEILLTVTNIDEQRKIKALLVASEKRYLALFSDASDAVAIADEHGRLEEVNRQFALLLGYGEEELRGMSIENIHPASELPRIRKHFSDIVRSGIVVPLETAVLRKDGTRVDVEIRPTQCEIDGRTVAQGIFIDLTERRRQEQQRLEQERIHRNTLVREVHHRIKNNLQSVAGLLQRELGKFMELDPRLETAISQIHAISVVHGLQAAHPDESIRLCDSLRNICRMVSDLSRRPVQFAIEHEHTTFRPVEIESNEAVSVALILNELVLNAVKHSRDSNHVATVSLRADGRSAIIVMRNTMNDAPGFDISAAHGLGTGLRLVRSLFPEQGAQLRHEPDADGFMLTTLTLNAPVLLKRARTNTETP